MAAAALEAALEGNLAALETLLGENRAKVLAARGSWDTTPLLNAVEARHEGAVRLLLSAGADPNARDAFGNAPLLMAARNGDDAVLKALIAAGADLEARDGWGWTPLLMAARRGSTSTLLALIAAGADLEARSTDGQLEGATAVVLSVYCGHLEASQTLVEEGARLRVATAGGREALSFASSAEMLALLQRAALAARMRVALHGARPEAAGPLGSLARSRLYDRRVWRVVARFVGFAAE